MKDWRSNGIMVPYGFVLWALRDAMKHPSSAEDCVDEFLRAEFENYDDAFQRQILDIIDIHLRSPVEAATPAYHHMLQTRKVTIWKPLYEHLLAFRMK